MDCGKLEKSFHLSDTKFPCLQNEGVGADNLEGPSTANNLIFWDKKIDRPCDVSKVKKQNIYSIFHRIPAFWTCKGS